MPNPKRWSEDYIKSGQYERDKAHKVRPQLPECKFGWKDDHEYCETHKRFRLECETYAKA